MSKTTFPKFVEDEGSIFRLTSIKGMVRAEIFDKKSSTFKRVKSSADVLWNGKVISPNDLPPEIRNAKK